MQGAIGNKVLRVHRQIVFFMLDILIRDGPSVAFICGKLEDIVVCVSPSNDF